MRMARKRTDAKASMKKTDWIYEDKEMRKKIIKMFKT